MAYHNGRTLPNYWAYARHFVLNDHMFASNISWSLTEHLYMVSEWSARCARYARPRSCVGTVTHAKSTPDKTIRSANAIFECSNADLSAVCDRRLRHFGLGPAHRFHGRTGNPRRSF